MQVTRERFWPERAPAQPRGQRHTTTVLIEGTLYLPTGAPIDLMNECAENNRRIIPMTVKLLRTWI